jgi:hypothetical protein
MNIRSAFVDRLAGPLSRAAVAAEEPGPMPAPMPMPMPSDLAISRAGVPAPDGGVTRENLALVTPAPEVPDQHPRHARIALPGPVRAKLERLERAAVGARAVVVDLGARIDTERERLRALERERESWGPYYYTRLSQSDVAQHEAKVAAAATELARLEGERDAFQGRVQALGCVVNTARAYCGVKE